jgi:hypothetical protein
LPSEQTSASVAAAALVAQHGAKVMMLSDDAIDVCYQGVKTRLKQLYRAEPETFLQQLPATPAQLAREHLPLALKIFSREDPPIPCPLNTMLMDRVRQRIQMRPGGGRKKTVFGGSTGATCPTPPPTDKKNKNKSAVSTAYIYMVFITCLRKPFYMHTLCLHAHVMQVPAYVSRYA